MNRTIALLVAVAVGVVGVAYAQHDGEYNQGRPTSASHIQEDGVKLAPQTWLNCATGITCTVDATNKRIDMATTGGAPVTSVTASAPLASSGGVTPDIALTGIVPIANGGTGISSTPSGAGQLLRASGAGTWAVGTVTFPDAILRGQLLYGNSGATGLTKLTLNPVAGTFLRSNGADPTWSTASLPDTVAGAGQILRASGANAWAASTVTWPDSVTTGHALWSTALNAWTASANPYWAGAHEWGDAIGGGDAIVLSRDPLGGVGQADGNRIHMVARSNDGSAHYANWNVYVDVTSNAGASRFLIEGDLDSVAGTDLFSIGNDGLVTTTGSVDIGDNATADTLTLTNVRIDSDVTLSQGANRTIAIAEAAAGNGNNLFLTGGAAKVGGGGNGGGVVISGGAPDGAGTYGSVVLGAAPATSTNAYLLIIDTLIGTIVKISTGQVASFDASGFTLSASKIVRQSQGTDLASANNMVTPTANYCDVTGAVQINTMATTSMQAGTLVTLQFDGAPTVKHATAGTGAQFFLQGAADFVTSANDTLMVVFDGTYWREVSRSVN